ncbi:hypothetical protein AB0D14_41230 [Streptomyces sp. NPDC048484]|uniref:hypothetical protein n=1 Tax=Streptomyces sp. NPDC048484 TaxID=3155146 RepID=UPI00342BD231
MGSEPGMAGLIGDEPVDRVVGSELSDDCAHFAGAGEVGGDRSCQTGAGPGRDGAVDEDQRMCGGDLQETVCVVLADAGTHQQKWAAW